jgi:hypothetical protein
MKVLKVLDFEKSEILKGRVAHKILAQSPRARIRIQNHGMDRRESAGRTFYLKRQIARKPLQTLGGSGRTRIFNQLIKS